MSIIYGCNNVNNNKTKTKWLNKTAQLLNWQFCGSDGDSSGLGFPPFSSDLVHASATSRWFCDFSVMLSIGRLVLKLVSDIWFHPGSRLNTLVLLHEASYPLDQLGLVQPCLRVLSTRKQYFQSYLLVWYLLMSADWSNQMVNSKCGEVDSTSRREELQHHVARVWMKGRENIWPS